MSLEGKDLLKIAKQVLGELGVATYQGLEITYRLKTKNQWQVNFQFKRIYGSSFERGCFAVDTDTGEITFAGLNRQYP
jgi:hypothetical protein